MLLLAVCAAPLLRPELRAVLAGLILSDMRCTSLRLQAPAGDAVR